jgi:hypothetical protein
LRFSFSSHLYPNNNISYFPSLATLPFSFLASWITQDLLNSLSLQVRHSFPWSQLGLTSILLILIFHGIGISRINAYRIYNSQMVALLRGAWQWVISSIYPSSQISNNLSFSSGSLP